jgi:hypothetical protein
MGAKDFFASARGRWYCLLKLAKRQILRARTSTGQLQLFTLADSHAAEIFASIFVGVLETSGLSLQIR